MTVTADRFADRARSVLLQPYTNLKLHEEIGPLVIDRGEGVTVYDRDGRDYIEGLAGLWCTALGFNEPRLIEAAVRQFHQLPFYHTFGHKAHGPGLALAEALIDLAPVPMSKVFFANSGSEANDTAVKLIWYYNNARGRPHKKKIIARLKGYHGVTVATASLTGLPINHRDFDLPIAGVLHTGCPHPYRFAAEDESDAAFAQRMADELDALIRREGPDTVAAFFAEPVMAAGGVIVPPAEYFPRIQEVLRAHDVLLVADEVVCAFGRTGNWWGSQTFDIKPDLITTAKALSSAYLPISALLISEPIFQGLIAESERVGVFGHGYTYSGHPVAAAVALEALAIYRERDIIGHVRAVAPRFQARLRALADHPLVGEARGVGLIGAVELVADKTRRTPFPPTRGIGARAAKLCLKHGLINRAMGDSLALAPPLIITEAEIDRMFDRLTRSLDDMLAELGDPVAAAAE